ncbi:MAG: serine/threonine-protein kinase, partial [Planctomycetota bacterium]
MTQPERICRECGIAWTGQGNRCPRCEMVATQEFSPQPSDFTQESESSQASDFTQPADVTLDTPVVADTSNAAKRPVNSLVRAGADRSTHFGDYELVKEIARGGMGVVYKAKHRKLQRLTAVKMMLGGRFSSADAMNRFRLEAEAAASLDHPGIVPIYEIGESEGQPFFAMKYIEGGSLASSRDAFVGDPKRIAALIRDIARAVHHAHQRGVLHRDIKPANILIDESGRPLLTDLGLAKRTNEQDGMTRTDAVMGTPAYMSPEQAG